MADLIPAPVMMEPVIVPTAFCTIIDVEVTAEYVRFVCSEDLPTLDGDQAERRIVARVAFPLSTARDLLRDLRRDLSQGRH